MGNPAAKQWAKIRGETPLFGYLSLDEAVDVLSEFLDIPMDEPKRSRRKAG